MNGPKADGGHLKDPLLADPTSTTMDGRRAREPLLDDAAGDDDYEVVDAEHAFDVTDDPTEVAKQLAKYERNHVGYWHGIPVHQADPPEDIPDAEVVA